MLNIKPGLLKEMTNSKLGQGLYKMSSENFVMPKSKEMLKHTHKHAHMGYVKDFKQTQEPAERAPNAKN